MKISQLFNAAAYKFSPHEQLILDPQALINKDPKAEALFKTAHAMIMATVSDPAAREPYDVMRKNVENGDAKVILSVNNADSKNPKIKGAVVGYSYEDQKVGLLGYVAPENGSLKQLKDLCTGMQNLLAKANGDSYRGTFMECNDPAKTPFDKTKAKNKDPDSDNMNPADRIKNYLKLGAKLVGINYVQPPLDVGAKESTGLILVGMPDPKTGKLPDTGAIKGYVDGINGECKDYCKPKNIAQYEAQLDQLAKFAQSSASPYLQQTQQASAAAPRRQAAAPK